MPDQCLTEISNICLSFENQKKLATLRFKIMAKILFEITKWPRRFSRSSRDHWEVIWCSKIKHCFIIPARNIIYQVKTLLRPFPTLFLLLQVLILYRNHFTYTKKVPEIFIARINLPHQRNHKNTTEKLCLGPKNWRSKLARRHIRTL